MTAPRVLLVEDEAPQVRALTLLLREDGFELHSAPNGEAALLMIAREPAYAAIVTDVHLPGMSGAEVAQRLRGPRLVGLTGDVRALQHLRHFDEVLVKPCVPTELVRAIRGPGGRLGHA